MKLMPTIEMLPMPPGIECSWCGSDHTEHPSGQPYRNRDGEAFCSKNHRTSSNRALLRLINRTRSEMNK